MLVGREASLHYGAEKVCAFMELSRSVQWNVANGFRVTVTGWREQYDRNFALFNVYTLCCLNWIGTTWSVQTKTRWFLLIWCWRRNRAYLSRGSERKEKNRITTASILDLGTVLYIMLQENYILKWFHYFGESFFAFFFWPLLCVTLFFLFKREKTPHCVYPDSNGSYMGFNEE